MLEGAAAGADLGADTVVGGYSAHVGWYSCQPGGDNSPHRDYAGPSGPGECSPERRRTAAGDVQSGGNWAVHRSRICTPEVLRAALVARLLESVAFASLALCERKGVKDHPSLWGWSDG
jgi:hypothetical protein